jgi:hypothetical protein
LELRRDHFFVKSQPTRRIETGRTSAHS